MTVGSVAKWHVKEGDVIRPGDNLADIETDKATMAFENQEDGVVARLLVADGARDLPVGAPVAVMVEDAADVAAFADYDAGGGGGGGGQDSPAVAPAPPPPPSLASPPAAAAVAAPASSAAPPPPHIELGLPALSPTMETGTIVAWHVKEGDVIRPGDNLADIETDKATMAFENQEDGVVARLLVPAGARDVRVGTPVALVVEDAELVPLFAGVPAGGGGSGGQQEVAAAAAAPAAAAGGGGRPQKNPRIGPAARFALAEAGLEASDLPPGTGPNGIVTKEDVMAAVASGVRAGGARPAAAPAPAAAAAAAAPAAAAAAAAAPKPPRPAAPAAARAPAAPAASLGAAGHTDVPNSQVRRIIAARLLESKLTAPSAYASADVDLGPVMALRRELLAASGLKISLNDCVVRAAALALRAAPGANAAWDAERQSVVLHSAVDVAVAVATDGGLITPIVRGADAKSLRQVADEVRLLAARARENALKPEEYMGGTFTVSNLGMFGLDSFSAIINPPQGAILAVGGAREEARVSAAGGLEAATTMTATLSCDERAVGADAAAAFLGAFAGFFARPASLLV